ncbi:MAG: sigma-70 family RNA polymerase sigma factor [Planctomycetota bacterium]
MPDAPDGLLEHTAFVRSVARAALRGDDLVDDVVQDTMVTALEESHRRRGPLRPWLGGVARNKARNLARRRAARRRWELGASRPEGVEAVDELVARAEEGRRLVAAVLGLEELYREPILLRYYEGLPPREIARRLDVPVETARTRLKRGIAKLRVELARSYGEEPGGWRAALLPLLRLPVGRPGPAAALIAGGAMMGKKWIAWALIALVLVGGGLVLRSWGDGSGASESQAGEPLAGVASEPAQPELLGPGLHHEEAMSGASAPIDMAGVDRQRDLHGWIVRADGSPVSGATITPLRYPWRQQGAALSYERSLQSIAGGSSASALDGSFRVPLEVGELVHLRVQAPGLATTEWTYLQAGERVRLVLTAPVRLVVLASGPDGQPVVGMPVRLFVSPARTGPWVERTALTDAGGRAVFDDLPAGLEGWIDPNPQIEGGGPGVLAIEPGHRGAGASPRPASRSYGAGRIVDAQSNEPSRGARVATNWAFVPEVLTDAKGSHVA